IDFSEYFEDIIGVTLHEGDPVVVELKVARKLWPYIETKPLHGSQKKKKEEETFVVLSLEVIPNFELEKLILSFGEEIEVLSPAMFRVKIMGRINGLQNNYN